MKKLILIFLCAWLLPIGTFALDTVSSGKVISFDGEISESKPEFVKQINKDLFFVINFDEINITDIDGVKAPESRLNFIRFYTPPLRSHNPVDLNGYISAYEQIDDRNFCFLADKSKYAKAEEAVLKLYWPKTDYDMDKSFNILSKFKTGKGKFSILDAKINGKDYREYKDKDVDFDTTHITYIKFKVDLLIPSNCGWDIK